MKIYLNLFVVVSFFAFINPLYAAPRSFDSALEAQKELLKAVISGSTDNLLQIFGNEAKELIFSGDTVADEAALNKFAALIRQKYDLVSDGANKMFLEAGNNKWLFPIPIINKAGKWSFDVKEGKEEILNRRIGENELNAIKITKFYVDAQKLYASEDRDGDGIKEYAQTLISQNGQKNGLYWESKEKTDVSPLGPLVAKAISEGYGKTKHQLPLYKGYYFKALTKQGTKASSGLKNYLTKNGNMTEGFALLAFPAEWNTSGIMSFIVNQDGQVYEKNLGKNSKQLAAALDIFDPDSSWKAVN